MKKQEWEFPGSSVVKISCFHCRGHEFQPWSGNWDPTGHLTNNNNDKILHLMGQDNKEL